MDCIINGIQHSILGKILFYRYQSDNNRLDVVHRVKIEKSQSQIIGKWGYLDGLAGKVKTAQQILVQQSKTLEEARAFAKPFVGITTNRKPVKNLLLLKKTQKRAQALSL